MAIRTLPQVLTNYAELARISNLPTCISNTLVGCALGAGERGLPWPRVPAIAAAICLFYVAGMALNDAVDAGLDRVERPERPIPSGRIGLAGAYLFSGFAFAAGLAILFGMSRPAFVPGLALVAVIVLYDLLHKRFAWAVLLMGASRGLVYVVAAAAAIDWPLDTSRVLTLAATLAAYTVVITVVARAENQSQLDARRWLAAAMPLIVIACAALLAPPRWLTAALAALVLTAWLARAVNAVFQRPPRTKTAVLTWISGICLVDMYFLALLDRPAAALAALGCFLLTVYGQRHVMGT